VTHFATSVDGTRLAYWVYGTGPAVLIVHGAGGDQAAWARLLPMLDRDCTVITFARRGRVPSGDTLPYSAEREVEDVVTLAELLQPACVLGHSFGTFLVLEAARASRALRSLILYEAWPDPADPMNELPKELPQLEQLAAEGRAVEIIEFGEPPESLGELRKDWRWEEYVRCALATPREVRAVIEFWAAHPVASRRWSDVDIPMLLLYGESNPEQGAGALELAATLRKARVEMLPGAGHRAQYENPGVLAQAIRRFLAIAEASR
jgi:pimeloyl-ACP methyl ester carboxylesterase